MILRYNIFTLLWAALILFLTLVPGQNLPEFPNWQTFAFDKSAHMFVFSVLVLLAIVGFKKQSQSLQLRLRATPVAILGSVAYGMLIEIIQSFIPERSFEWFDMLANSTGCLLGALAFFFIYKL
ncbi:VanZ like family protein [Catalinimonas alkaloidigena]|uniref:VanZ like family protein n=1 Tax=Catalinimonas alkaloidigena TaxID=1075417 RepID=A0A1G9DRE7_9BACT|nr:VanZ family protein [Catalinimonas alkaloidigena]SDK66443.1 VanZ like family protein [Catalinimonas alkaloidigena]